MPTIIIIAGLNGAGKTSFANKHFGTSRPGLLYLNADEIARTLAHLNLPEGELNFRAGRAMLRKIDELVSTNSSFMFETTLASLTYARKIPAWQNLGYAVALIYLRLPSIEMSIGRVLRRVKQGGHSIPEDVIRQRFAKSADYLEKYYKPLVNEWHVWDSLEGTFHLAQSWNDP